jgi:Lsr2
MRQVITVVKINDDLDFTRDGTETEAVVTVTVGLNGIWRELDLSEANDAGLQAVIQPYLDAGRPPEEDPAQKKKKKTGATPGYHIPAETIEYGKRLRAFAQENGFRYLTDTGKYYYSQRLKKAYAAHLAKEREGLAQWAISAKTGSTGNLNR